MISYPGITQTNIKTILREVDTSKEIIPEPFNLFYLHVFEEEFGFLIFMKIIDFVFRQFV